MRVEALTCLRFIAALIVIFFHHGHAVTGLSGFLFAGPEMVTFFFVLSGFVLVLSYYFKNKVAVATYFISRFARIAPLYILALAISTIYVFGLSNNTSLALVLNLLFIQSWFPSHSSTFNSPDWAISVQMFFYFLFPFILTYLKKSNIRPASILLASLFFWLSSQAVLALILCNFYRPPPCARHFMLFFSPIPHLNSFLLGVAGGYWIAKNSSLQASRPWSVFLILMSSFLTVTCLQYKQWIHLFLGFQPAFGVGFFAPLFLFLIISISISHRSVTRLLRIRALQFCGKLSYALYILQMPIKFVYKNHIACYLHLNRQCGFCVYLLLLFCVSVLALYLIEKPCGSFIQNHVCKIHAFLQKLYKSRFCSEDRSEGSGTVEPKSP